MNVGWPSINNFSGLISENNFPASRSLVNFSDSVKPIPVNDSQTILLSKNDTVEFVISSVPLIVKNLKKEKKKKKYKSRYVGKYPSFGHASNNSNDQVLEAQQYNIGHEYFHDTGHGHRFGHPHKKKHKIKDIKKHTHRHGTYCQTRLYKRGRGKRRRGLKKYMFPVMIGLMTAKAIILPMVLKILAIFSIKGFFLAILATVLSFVLSHKNYEHRWEPKSTKVEVIKIPIHEDHHHHTKLNEVVVAHEPNLNHPYKHHY